MDLVAPILTLKERGTMQTWRFGYGRFTWATFCGLQCGVLAMVSNWLSGKGKELMCSFCHGITNGIVRGCAALMPYAICPPYREIWWAQVASRAQVKNRHSKQLGTGELRVLITFVFNLVYLIVCIFEFSEHHVWKPAHKIPKKLTSSSTPLGRKMKSEGEKRQPQGTLAVPDWVTCSSLIFT